MSMQLFLWLALWDSSFVVLTTSFVEHVLVFGGSLSRRFASNNKSCSFVIAVLTFLCDCNAGDDSDDDHHSLDKLSFQSR